MESRLVSAWSGGGTGGWAVGEGRGQALGQAPPGPGCSSALGLLGAAQPRFSPAVPQSPAGRAWSMGEGGVQCLPRPELAAKAAGVTAQLLAANGSPCRRGSFWSPGGPLEAPGRPEAGVGRKGATGGKSPSNPWPFEQDLLPR